MTEIKPLFPQLCMRMKLENLEFVKLPEDYALRSYESGDSIAWNEIINSAFDRDNMDFNKLMRIDYAFRAKRVFFICYKGCPIATASAWFKPEWGKNTGYLHMVGTHPEHTGKGIGLQVSLAAMHQMVAEGREDVILQTDDFRIPALKIYLKLGFEPVPIHENQIERWKAIFKKLDKPDLVEKFKGCLGTPFYDIKHPRENLDYEERYPMAHIWHAGRPHRIGTTQTDALGDESLYKPSRLGFASGEPKSIKAASNAPLQLTYTAGEEALPAGTKVKFYIDGQGTLFRYTKMEKPDEDALVAVCSGSCTLKPFLFGFEITEGTLAHGDTVILEVKAFDWTPIANRYEVKVIIQKDTTEPTMRLPEPIIINVEPHDIERFQVMLPCTYKKGTLVIAKITARDRYDNRVPYSGEIKVTHNDFQGTIYMSDGLAQFKAPFESGGTETIKAAFEGKEYESNPCVNSESLQLYVGDLHVHDFLSAANGYSDQAYKWGRDDKSLDFISVAVQNHGWTDNEKWAIAKHFNERYHQNGEFITFLACEWQHSGYGDKIVHFLGGDQPFFTADDRRTNTVEKLYEAVKASDAFIISHHTSYKQKLWCGGTDYNVIDTDIERLVELWSMHGSSEGFEDSDRPLLNMDFHNTVQDALEKGLKLGFAAGSDTHSGRPGGSSKEPRKYWGGLTAVWAPEKTRRSIFKALMNRQTYALTDSRIVLKMTVNGSLMGSAIPVSDKAEIIISVCAPSPILKVQIIKNGNKMVESSPGINSISLGYTDEPDQGDYYYCRVILADGNLAVSSPVWLG